MQDKQDIAKGLRTEIKEKVKAYYQQSSDLKPSFVKGQRIPFAGRVFDDEEMTLLVDAALDFWLTSGPYSDRFEQELAAFLQTKHCLLVNSGSSANLLAFMALTSPLLKDRRISRGDEIITVAAGFPTTVAPMIHFGACPVFVDIALPSYNLDTQKLAMALTPKTKAVMLAHTLGNPFDIAAIKEFCDHHGLWLIEDNCDALGSRYCYREKWAYTGTFGHIGTSSFYPPHHMTMGEGGAVYTTDDRLHHIMLSLRDWGRACHCPPGRDNTCKNRFGFQLGALPKGYDHKYTYSHFGYNLKATDLQAAVGCAQLKKLPGFVVARKQNWARLDAGLKSLEQFFVLPQKAPDSDPSWFGYLLTVKPGVGFDRAAVVDFLEARNIQTRMLFAGNLLRQPCCMDWLQHHPESCRVVGDLANTDLVMNNTFWIGCYPGLLPEMIDHMTGSLQEFCERFHRV